MRDIILKELSAKNVGVTIAATCYLLVATVLSFILVPLFMLLVDFRYKNPGGAGSILITTDQWMESLPPWSYSLYNLEGTLLVTLAVWVVINILHHSTTVLYDHWVFVQKQKYPLSY